MARAINTISDDTVVVLRDTPISLKSDVGLAFVCDVARNAEELISDKEICEKYGLETEAWREITEKRAVVRAVRAEHERRVRSGVAAQEAAALYFSTAPKVLNGILHDVNASPRHRIESARELRQTAIGDGAEAAVSSGERFTVVINLSADEQIKFEKMIEPITPDKNNWRGSDGDEK